MGRRIKRIILGADFIRHLLEKGRYPHLVQIEGLPKDAKYLGQNFDPLSNTVMFFLEHESFDEVPEGEIVPTFTNIGITCNIGQVEKLANFLLENFQDDIGDVDWEKDPHGESAVECAIRLLKELDGYRDS